MLLCSKEVTWHEFTFWKHFLKDVISVFDELNRVHLSLQTVVINHDLRGLEVFASHHLGFDLRRENQSVRL